MPPVHSEHGDRRAYFREHRRKKRGAATPCPPPTANAIKAAWNSAPIAEREGFMIGLGRMRDLRDDFA